MLLFLHYASYWEESRNTLLLVGIDLGGLADGMDIIILIIMVMDTDHTDGCILEDGGELGGNKTEKNIKWHKLLFHFINTQE